MCNYRCPSFSLDHSAGLSLFAFTSLDILVHSSNLTHWEKHLEPQPHEFRRLACLSCGHMIDVPVYCKDRFCPVCARPRRNRVAARIKNATTSLQPAYAERWRFVTLTIRSQFDADEMLDKLYNSFRKLRQRKWWKKLVRGGVSVAEVTAYKCQDAPNVGKIVYHVHLHLLILSRFMPQRELSRQWKSISGDSIVDVRLMPLSQAIGYVTSYVTKCPDLNGLIIGHLLRDRRLYQSFGECHGIKYTAPKEHATCENCKGQSWCPLDVIERYNYSHGVLVDHCDP